jgi:hypothetical protein
VKSNKAHAAKSVCASWGREAGGIRAVRQNQRIIRCDGTALPPKADIDLRARDVPLVPLPDSRIAAKKLYCQLRGMCDRVGVACLRSGNKAVIRNGTRFRLEGLLLAFALTLTACTVGRPKEDTGSTNLRPENYKSDILGMLHVYFRDPTQIRDAAASEPKLQLVGQRNRYVVCLRFNAKKSNGEYAGTKQYLAIFVAGRLDQMIEAKPEECAAAEYQPFPEAEKLSR